MVDSQPTRSTSGFGSISHPSITKLIPFLSEYPLQAASLIQSWLDLNHSSGWTQLEIVEIRLEEQVIGKRPDDQGQEERRKPMRKFNQQSPRNRWVAIRGRRKDSRPKDPPEIIVPCGLDEMLTIQDFDLIFQRLDELFPFPFSFPSTSNPNPNPNPTPDPTSSAGGSTNAPSMTSHSSDPPDPKIKSKDPDRPTKSILLSILSNDSTIVYYKISRGLIKPVN